MPADDPYQILGVARGATADEIRTAYRALAKKHHPDLNPGNSAAEERFKAIASANDLLSDPDKRAKFDRGEIDAAGHERAPQPRYRDHAEGAGGRRYGPQADWADEDVGDMFGSIFGARRGPAGRGRDAHYSLTIAFLDAVRGTTSRLTLPDGQTLDVKIPAGTEDGGVMRLRGKGGKGHQGAPDGDALIVIHMAPHAFYTREGSTIRLDLPVTLTEAVLGGPVEVPTPGGPVRMRIPPHSDTGTVLRLRGRGVPAHGSAPAGDLYATLRVVLPPPDAALDEFLATWKPEGHPNPRAAMESGS
jgi:DnaJ-class molecular chaperone